MGDALARAGSRAADAAESPSRHKTRLARAAAHARLIPQEMGVVAWPTLGLQAHPIGAMLGVRGGGEKSGKGTDGDM